MTPYRFDGDYLILAPSPEAAHRLYVAALQLPADAAVGWQELVAWAWLRWTDEGGTVFSCRADEVGGAARVLGRGGVKAPSLRTERPEKAGCPCCGRAWG